MFRIFSCIFIFASTVVFALVNHLQYSSPSPVPRTELSGDSDRYVKTGSTVHLQCTIYGAIEPPTYIMWYHDAQPIHADNKLGYKMHLIKSNVQRSNSNSDAAVKYELNDLVQTPFDDTLQRRQNSVSITHFTHKNYTSIRMNFHLTFIISHIQQIGSLLIESTRKYHSGNYSCNPSNSAPATVTLHVISSKWFHFLFFNHDIVMMHFKSSSFVFFSPIFRWIISITS